MRRFVVNVFLFGAVGAVLGSVEIHIDTWQYWAILGSMAIACINVSME
jgi:hypothetical protein